MGVSENVVYPIVPNGFADHYPYEMAISLGIYPIFRQTHLEKMMEHGGKTMKNHEKYGKKDEKRMERSET